MDTNYTTKSQEAISGAMQAAAAAGNPQIEPAHLLVELLSQPDGVAAGLLNSSRLTAVLAVGYSGAGNASVAVGDPRTMLLTLTLGF